MRFIYDYKDIQKLDKSEISSELESGIIITATSALAKSLSAFYPRYTVIDIHEIIAELLPEWDENTKDLYNYIALRNTIENYASNLDLGRNIYLSLQRNASDIWNSILLLMEADVYPQDIPDNVSVPIQHFKNIWKQLEVENSILMNLRARFVYSLTEKKELLERFNFILKQQTNGKINSIVNKSFYLMGFYFITPIQARILDVLENAGIKLTYLNCRDEKNPYICEIWERTFSQEYKSGNYKDIQPQIKNYFLDILSPQSKINNIEITKYSSNLELAESIKEPLLKGEEIYTPEIKKCEKILKEYYPDYFNRKHLLSYPVGQYIYNLHMMWNGLYNRLELKYEYVYKCFSSGWLENGKINGKNYLYELKKIEVYFKDCVTFEDWRSRFKLLKEAKECVSVFEFNGHEKRWHELLGNPFHNLSVYNVSKEKLQDIEDLLLKLMEQAEYLFKVEAKTSISRHFKKIIKIIKGHLSGKEILDDDSIIAEELIKSLAAETTRELECPLNAIKDAIVLLIGGHFDEVDSLDQETACSDEKIAALSNIESSLLTAKNKDVYLVLADEFTLPGKPKELPWPLSDELINSLMVVNREDTRRYVNYMQSIITNRPLSYRYLFSVFMANYNSQNNTKLHISWVENQDSSTVDASPYVLLLDPHSRMQKRKNSSIEYEKEINVLSVNHEDIDIRIHESSILPSEVVLDYGLCKYRYLYSYLLNYLPEFSSDFHYSFLLTNMIKAISHETNKTKEEVENELFQLFPFFRNVEMHQASDYAYGVANKEPETFDGAQYPNSRLYIHYLTNEIMNMAEKLSEDETSVKEKDKYKKCIYCPYASVCIYKIANY